MAEEKKTVPSEHGRKEESDLPSGTPLHPDKEEHESGDDYDLPCSD